MLGAIMIWVALAAAIVSAYSYFQSATKKTLLLQRARMSFFLMVATVMGASVLLMLYILRHQFEFEYVWSYSSRSLPLELLVTTFWAGQEGSFLFWALCSALIGLFLMRYTRERQIEHEAMSVYAFLQAFLLLLLTVKSPFQYIWDAFPGEVAAGRIPADGRGLNPLLQNFWMIVHPPVLFVGFAAMAVPFSFAVGALWRKTYSEWIPNALPWVLFGALALGAGLMLGGYWAYGVLGWGGWWGWDPVENSSLIPWIIGVALIHTMIVQKKTGKLVRTNFVLAIFAFILVIYSTFLTRSGILGEASVHSFVDPGALAYTLLIAWIATITALGSFMFLRRWKEMRTLSQAVGIVTRESLLSLGSIAMGVSALIILFGTSLPIFSNSKVEASFYDSMNLPLAVLMGLLIGVSLLVQYRVESGKGLLNRSLAPLISSVIALAVFIYAGLDDLSMIVLAFASLFAFFVSLRNGYRMAKERPLLLGGSLAHIGVAMLFLAIIGSGHYGQKVTASLTMNEQKSVLGYDLTYRGSKPTQDGKFKFTVEAKKNGQSFNLEPVMFQSSYNNSLMRNPDYTSFLTRDFYIEPVSLEEGTSTQSAGSGNVLELTRGEPATIGDVKVTFVRFEMNQHSREGMTGGEGFAVGAVLEVQRGKSKEQVTPVTIYKQDGKLDIRAAMLKDGVIGFQILNMNVDMESKKSKVQVNVIGLNAAAPSAQKTEMLVIEASLKPFMSFVWLASVLVFIGFGFAFTHRNKEVNHSLLIRPRKNEKKGTSASVVSPEESIPLER